MRKLIPSLLLIAVNFSAVSVAQVTISTGSAIPIPPPPTAYGLELIRAEQWPPPGGGDQPAIIPAGTALPSEADSKSIGDYRRLIKQLEIDQGPYADDLTEALSGLAYNYQHSGEHQKAIDSFNRVIHLARINRGPFTEEQLPLLDSLRKSMFAEKALNDLDRLEEYIYLVHKRALDSDDPRREQATRDYVRWQRSAYLQNVGDGDGRLMALDRLFNDALNELEKREAPKIELLPQLQGALQVAYLIGLHDALQRPAFDVRFQQGPLDSNYSAEELRRQQLQETNYRSGLRTVKELVAATEQETPEVRAQALVARGDWYLWQGKRISARRSYIEAFELLAGNHENERQKFFREPVELPDELIFLPDISLEKREPRGRAKVRFNVSRDGRLRDLEILEISPKGDEGAEIALKKMLRNLYFRPRIENGKAVETGGLEREYVFFDSLD